MPFEAEFAYNRKITLRPELREMIEDAVTWRKPWTHGAGRSAIIRLKKPLVVIQKGREVEIRALKLKGIGDFRNPDKPVPPTPRRFESDTSFHTEVDEKGDIVPVAPKARMVGGLMADRARNEAEASLEAFEKGVNTAVPVAFGKYKDLSFEG